MPRNDLIVMRNGAAALWTSTNPVLAEGELGAEVDTGLLKVGDGSTAWNTLGYTGSGGGGAGTLDQGVAYADAANDRVYITFGVSGNWEAIRYTRNVGDASTGAGQSGPVPTTLVALQGLTYT